MSYQQAYHAREIRAPFARQAGIVMSNAIAHFRRRAASWYMALVNIAIGVIFTVNPDGLTHNPGADVYLAYVNRIADPDVWRVVFIGMGSARLLALLVNGSFPRIWWTPHVRMMLSGLSAVVWLQFAFSVCLIPDFLAIATVLFPSIVCLEAYNTAVAAYETKRHPEGEFG